jgi:hypothetical protein
MVQMKKTAVALTLILALLFSAVGGVQFINKAKAETLGPISTYYSTANTVEISSPQNETYNVSSILLNFKVETYGVLADDIGFSLDEGAVERVTNLTKISEVPAPPEMFLLPPYVLVTFKGNVSLSNLSRGNHSVTVYQGIQYSNRYEVEAYAHVNFTIDLPPNILITSPENKVYNSSVIPLNFTVDKPFSQATYSLDGQDNVTVSGNVTLTDLPNGEHNVTVYAQDNAGTIGASETINFAITRQPEPEPFPSLPVAVASGTSLAAIGVGLLVYFKKRKHQG